MRKFQSKVLLYFLGNEDIYPIPYFSDYMIVVGPYLNQRSYNYVKLKINVSPGLVSLAPILEVAKDTFSPDVLLSWNDATGHFLKETHVFNGFKGFILGDGHHMYRPIEKYVNYAKKEKFDLLIVGHRQFGKIYSTSCNIPTIWLPGIITFVDNLDPIVKTEKKIISAGQAGGYHVRRYQTILALQQLGLPIEEIQVRKEYLATLYNESAISLNISLNGDMNFRWFETLAAGGVLICDRLCKDSGVDEFFSMEEVPTFSTIDEAYSLMQNILNNSELRYEIASKAQTRYKKELSRSRILENLWDIIGSRKPEPIFTFWEAFTFKNPQKCRHFFDLEKIRIYQVVQECVRISDSVTIHINDWPEVHPNLFDDFTTNANEFSYYFLKQYSKVNISFSEENSGSILLTNNFSQDNLVPYDLVLEKVKKRQCDNDNYDLIDTNDSFNIFRRNLFKGVHKKNVNVSELIEGISTPLEYEVKLLKHFLSKCINQNECSILLIGGNTETLRTLQNTGLKIFRTQLSDLESCFVRKNKRKYDIVFFLDDSVELLELVDKIKSVFGYMKLSSILVFHSNRFLLGPLGWKDDYPFIDKITGDSRNDWSHIQEALNSLSGSSFSLDDFANILEGIMIENPDQNLKYVNYNSKSIKALFYNFGFKIISSKIFERQKEVPLQLRNKKLDFSETHFLGVFEKNSWIYGDSMMFPEDLSQKSTKR